MKRTTIRWFCLFAFILVSLTSFASSIPDSRDGTATYYTTASCQSEGTSGVYTANGEKFDESALTCAMRSREWGSHWKVSRTLPDGSVKTIIVRLSDYGPGRGPTAKGVIIDLTPAGWKALGATTKIGNIKVHVERWTDKSIETLPSKKIDLLASSLPVKMATKESPPRVNNDLTMPF